jgi:hypothetical protein
LNGLNALNELNAPNYDNRDRFFLEREKASCFPKIYFTRPFNKQIRSPHLICLTQGEAFRFVPVPCLSAKAADSISFVFEIESHVWGKRKFTGFVSQKRFLKIFAETNPAVEKRQVRLMF